MRNCCVLIDGGSVTCSLGSWILLVRNNIKKHALGLLYAQALQHFSIMLLDYLTPYQHTIRDLPTVIAIENISSVPRKKNYQCLGIQTKKLTIQWSSLFRDPQGGEEGKQTRALTVFLFPPGVWVYVIIVKNMPGIFSDNIFINCCSGNSLNSEWTDVTPLKSTTASLLRE